MYNEEDKTFIVPLDTNNANEKDNESVPIIEEVAYDPQMHNSNGKQE